MPVYNKKELERLLPHRDNALCIEKAGFFGGKEVRCLYCIEDENDFRIKGHFPKKPISPGHWLTEAMSIASLLLVRLTNKTNGELPLLLECNAKFHAMVFPPAKIFLTPKLVKSRGNKFFVFSVTARQNGTLIATAEIKGAILPS